MEFLRHLVEVLAVRPVGVPSSNNDANLGDEADGVPYSSAVNQTGFEFGFAGLRIP
jgi:hypothetical protein